MNSSIPSADDHAEVWNLLPWLVNGRLGEEDRRRVAAHLNVCGLCRDETALQRRIYALISADSGLEHMPMAGLNKLRQRLDSTGPAAAPSDRPPPLRRLPRQLLRRPAATGIAASMIGVCAALGVCTALGVSAALYWHRSQRPFATADYHTVTDAAPQPATAVIRAVFAPTVTVAELQTLLDDCHLRIVSGPTEAGVYSLAMNGSQAVGWSLRRLRARGGVRFAEAIGPTSPAAVAPP
jgi:anti-sigma factor RsiW